MTCRCTYPGCTRHGKCKECLEYHREKAEFPACFFTPEGEKTYDRSWKNLQKFYRFK
ncbi:MAG TPA: DUF6485 family protein [Spirochaetota bacterium]|nr:DUF6485 family protein [Spirochaetota bacterium]HOM38462.1 DUF6485 family protein [Spirochaetota bacterium]HPQ49002.1 DUF6485 family protein [Spirochaetota bacterium]